MGEPAQISQQRPHQDADFIGGEASYLANQQGRRAAKQIKRWPRQRQRLQSRTFGVFKHADTHGDLLFVRPLFDRHTFGEIARLVHVTAAQHRHVVRQQLQRHDG